MKRWIIFVIFCTTTLLFGIGTPHKEITNAPVPDIQKIGKKVSVDPDFGKIPLYFIANQGQTDEQALFYARTSRYTLWATKQGLVFDSIKKENINGKVEGRDVSRLIFLNALPNPEIVPGKLSDYRVNFLKGNDKSGWHTQVPTSERVCYKNLYNAIDLEVYGMEKQIEYDWVIKPGGNPMDIRFDYQNIKKSFIDETGNLVIRTAFGEWLHKKPVGYQVINGKREAVDIAFIKRGKSPHIYGFKVSCYDKNYELIIDPMVVAFSTYLGGDGDDVITGMTINGSGAIYVTGFTGSVDFPLMNAYQGTTAGELDAFVTKLSADGSALVFSTYLGGMSGDMANSIAVDGDGIVYTAGVTFSTDFPVANAYQSTNGGFSDGFIAKLSANGSTLLYSTYLGGSGDEMLNDIAVNSSGEMVAAGQTFSSDFPLQNAVQSLYDAGGYQNAGDAFITKFYASGAGLVYSTYLGGTSNDAARAVKSDNSGNVYVGGETSSYDFPTANAHQASKAGSVDAFLTKISPDGSSLAFSTYLGGNRDDQIYDIALDSSGVYLTGSTFSSNFPTTSNAYQQTKQGNPDNYADAFVTKFTLSGSNIIYSTFLGGSGGSANGFGIAVDPGGSVHVTGDTTSPNFPQVGSLGYRWISSNAAYVTRFLADGSDINYSRVFVSSETMHGNGVQVDAGGNIYLAGRSANGLETYRAFQQFFGGPGNDGFIMKIIPSALDRITVTAPNGGETLFYGSTYAIQWTAPDVVQHVSISYRTNIYEDWTTITESTPNTGSYSWTVPFTDSNYCLVSINDTEMSTLIPGDVSDAEFTITTFPIRVTSPSGGENWAGGSTHNITWVDNGTFPDVSIAYSTDYGETWIPIAGPIANTGSYSWIVPETPSNSCLVKVSDPTETNTDWSDYAFTIYSLSAPFIAVTSPNGGEEWVGRTLHNITWTSTSAVTEVNIDYSRDGGATWIPIAGPIVNTGSYEWEVPPIPSTDCRVRVSHAGGTVSGVSNAAFTVKAPPLPQGERDALIALYNSTGGAGWTDSFNWRNPDNPSEFNAPGTEYTWCGITCSTDYSHVEKINLYNNNLNGTIPDLGALTELKELSMCGNLLSGNIPADLNSLTHLTNLSLYWNNLSGPLPDLGGLSNLVWLDLEGNQLSGSIPGWLNNLTNLEYLFIQDNGFTALIPDLSGLTKLKGLNIGTNNLTGTIPTWLNSLTNLETLSLNNNYLSGTIPDLGNLSLLRTLNLSNNLLTGSIPSWVANLTELHDLSLNNNQLTGTIEVVAVLTDLSYLTLQKNKFTGQIPALTGFTHLYTLNLSGNELSGNIPVELGQLTTLHSLYLNGNKLTGSIPSSLLNLTALYVNYLDIRWNGIFTSDSALKTFLNSKQYGWDWVSTQTIAPTGVSTSEVNYTSVKISWTPIVYTGNTGCYEVYYSTTPGSGYVYAGATANKTTNNFTVTNLNKGITYYFRVLTKTYSHYNNSNTVISDYSAEVSATTLLPTITVTAPNGGETWEGTTGHNITWSYTGTLTNVKIDYSTDNGASWNVVTASTANTGSYAWTVPNTSSANCLVRVGDVSSVASDQSDAVFTITPFRTITVTAPNGGETWMGYSSSPITWTSTGLIANVKIEYSTNNGSSWDTISASTANTGTYNWTIPNNISSATCLVKISDLSGPAVDQSNAVFTISPTLIPTAERDALIALYNSTNGDSWFRNYNWRKPGNPTQFNDPGTENTWHGVTLNTAGTHVEKVEIICNNFSGTLPLDLNNLTELTILDLSENTDLTAGPIPNLGNLAQLRRLNLRGCRRNGSIPASFNNLTNLKELYLSENELTGSLPGLGNLVNLEQLDLSSNQLTGSIPTYLNSLTNILYINLGINSFSGPIPDLSSMTNLRSLILYGNQLTGTIPTWLNSMTQLQGINLGGNQLTGTIPDLTALTQLVGLDLSTNQLSGSIPSWLNSLHTLKFLDLSNSQLTGAIPDLSNLTHLEWLKLSKNRLSGNIPENIGSLYNLTMLYLEGNQLKGSIPASIVNLESLYSDFVTQGLDIRWNGLYTDDPTISNFINYKSRGEWGEWENTQTIAPTNLSTGDIHQTSVQLFWTPILYGADAGEYQVYYSTTPGSGYVLAGTTASKYSNTYTVTELNQDTQYYFVIKTVTQPHTNNPNTIISDNSIEISATTLKPALYLSYPAGGESWEGNTVKQLMWATEGTVENVKLEYSINAGTSWNTIIESTPNNGTYNWTVPNTPATQCKVKVSDTASTASSQNWNYFAIVAARTITVTTPNGGENWEADSNQQINWTHTGNIPNVRIEYSTNNGLSWITIEDNVGNTGSYSWIVPSTLSSNCLVKVLDVAGPASDQSNAVFTIAPKRTITVTAPNGGESWEGNTAHAITWTYTGNIPDVKIEYSTNSGSSWNTITASTANTGSYNWTVPNSPSTNCLVKVSDAVGPASDQSNAVFTIVAERTVTVTSPNGGESWEGNTEHLITWAFTGNIPNVKIEYSTNSGSSWNTITASTANTGSYNWAVANTPSPNCLVKVSDIDGPASDQSNAVFTIVTARTITITSPNGGESWEGNTVHQVTWTTTGAVTTVKIEYSTDNGSSWSTVTNSTPSSIPFGAYNWTVANTPSTSCLVKVSDTAGPAIDQSNAVFTIVAERTVTVTSPNGGESWEANTVHPITWTSTGSIPNVRIDYSTDFGKTYETIIASTPNTGSYNWTVPYSYSTACKIRVKDAASYPYDESDAVFTIDHQRYIEVLVPNGGESWEGNTYHPLSWAVDGPISTVKIEYSTDNGSSWNTIKPSWSSGTYNWAVPNTPSTNCLLKVSDTESSVFDQSNAVFTIVAERTVTVTSPNGGESWEGNTEHLITWTFTGNIPNVKIEYSANNGITWNTIIASTANTGSYNWTVPNVASTNYLVKVSDTSGPAVDQSNAVFTIVKQRTVTVTSPNGGESWEGNTIHPITWTSTGSISNVMIEYSTNSGSSWNTITASTVNNGVFNWTVANTASSNCLVKVSDIDGPALDQSNAVFTIVTERTVTVTTPNGGESWEGNTSHAITWTSTGAVNNVQIEFSTNNGSSWNTITPSTANTGSYNWTVPNSPSTNCLVKVSDAAGSASDQSNAVFAIVTERTVTVTSANGSESWEGNTSHAITWTYTGNIPEVKIEYSTNGGSSWNTIAASTANTGSYNWTVPNSPSTNCLVKVSDAAGPASDQSNAPFTIVAYRSITVTSPNGGESWEGNTSYPITWTSTGSITNVMIEYSTNSGSSWNTITASTANSGSYNWTVPNTPFTTCLVKISDVAGPASDQSNALFAIVAYRTITVTLPNGAENLLANTTYPITWTNTGNIPNVMIQYSTNNGSSWNTITASTTNSGSYNWAIPASASTSCLVKVSDASGPALDQSNAVFTISNVTYCTSSGNSQTRGYIYHVVVGPLNNLTGSSGYTDFTSLIANLTAGSSVIVTLTPSGTTYTEYWKIWIDYNRDGDFADTGENVFGKSSKTAVSGSFTVPSATAKGTARMRVSMRYNNTPSYCGSFNYGEVEDYTVNIQ